ASASRFASNATRLDLSRFPSSVMTPQSLPRQTSRTPASPARRPPGMNRRTALMLSMLGGLVSQSLYAQSAGRKSSKSRDKTFAPQSSRDDQPDDAAASGDEPTSALPPEPGFQWRRYPISRYTRAATNQSNPQKAIIDWIFKRTGLAEWHGEK